MNHINHIVVEGILVSEPVSRTLSGSKAMASFRIVSRRTFKKTDGTWGEDTTFIDVEAWDHAANHTFKWLHKGARCAVTGRIKQDNWTDQKTGQNRSKLYIQADTITNPIQTATPATQPTAPDTQPTPHQQAKQNAYQPQESTDDIPF